MFNGIELIRQEREKQLRKRSPEHDDSHTDEQLVVAAQVYLYGRVPFAPSWPWDDTAPKFRSRIEDLSKAGALIAAEIDRLVREMYK